MLLGYAGTFLSMIAGGSPVSGQMMSGLHVFWLVLSAVILRRTGAATATGALKGLVEVFLVSHLGVFVLLVSLIEGLVVDVVLFLFRKANYVSFRVASGFSASSNVVFLQVFLIPNLPFLVYVMMYAVSFLSGLLLGGILAESVLKSLRYFLPKMRKAEKLRIETHSCKKNP